MGEDKDKLPRHLQNAPDKFAYLKKVYTEPEPDPSASVHLGTMNGWGEDKKQWPQQYRHCQIRKRKHAHKISETPLGRCLKEYECKKCKIKWSVDSSD